MRDLPGKNLNSPVSLSTWDTSRLFELSMRLVLQDPTDVKGQIGNTTSDLSQQSCETSFQVRRILLAQGDVLMPPGSRGSFSDPADFSYLKMICETLKLMRLFFFLVKNQQLIN